MRFTTIVVAAFGMAALSACSGSGSEANNMADANLMTSDMGASATGMTTDMNAGLATDMNGGMSTDMNAGDMNATGSTSGGMTGTGNSSSSSSSSSSGTTSNSASSGNGSGNAF